MSADLTVPDIRAKLHSDSEGKIYDQESDSQVVD